MNNAILMLGSNLGNKNENINKSLLLLKERVGEISKKTKLYTTVPVEYDSHLDYVNIGVSILTEKSPISLLQEIKNIENELGRTKDSSVIGHYSDRIIDIDIVCFNNIIFESDKLNIPHVKHLYDRDFSKIILKELGVLE